MISINDLQYWLQNCKISCSLDLAYKILVDIEIEKLYTFNQKEFIQWCKKYMEEEYTYKPFHLKTDIISIYKCMLIAKSYNPIHIPILGSPQITQFFIRTPSSEQHIVLVGEYHTTRGNPEQIFDILMHQFNCPIDILIESSFQNFFKQKDVHYSHPNSFCQWFETHFKKAFIRGKTPKDDIYIQDFYKRNIMPFKGKLKFWGIDYRMNSIFGILTIIQSNLQSNKKKILDHQLKHWLLLVLNYDMYSENPMSYDKVITLQFEEIINTSEFGHYYSFYLQKKTKIMTQKSHLKLMTYFSILHKDTRDHLLSYYTQIISNHDGTTNILNCLIEIDIIQRLYRIIHQNVNRITFVFCGNSHHSTIRDYFIKYPHFSLIDDTLSFHISLAKLYSSETDQYSNLYLKPIDTNKITHRMKLYSQN
jgi:hypothetical protein